MTFFKKKSVPIMRVEYYVGSAELNHGKKFFPVIQQICFGQDLRTRPKIFDYAATRIAAEKLIDKLEKTKNSKKRPGPPPNTGSVIRKGI